MEPWDQPGLPGSSASGISLCYWLGAASSQCNRTSEGFADCTSTYVVQMGGLAALDLCYSAMTIGPTWTSQSSSFLIWRTHILYHKSMSYSSTAAPLTLVSLSWGFLFFFLKPSVGVRQLQGQGPPSQRIRDKTKWRKYHHPHHQEKMEACKSFANTKNKKLSKIVVRPIAPSLMTNIFQHQQCHNVLIEPIIEIETGEERHRRLVEHWVGDLHLGETKHTDWSFVFTEDKKMSTGARRRYSSG